MPLGTRRVARRDRSAAAGSKRGHGAKPPPAGAAAARQRRRPRAAPGRSAAGACRIVALLALVLVVLAGWFLWSIYQPGAGEGSGRVVVHVPRGASVGEIGDLLADRGVIDSSFFFSLRAKLSGSAARPQVRHVHAQRAT